MVALGMADGMVSGAAHTTAETIRPAFELVKTAPGVAIVSSVFFMCLADHVLVYGDCAVNPNPTAEQLADIAISSAATAAQFGIEPRVAMITWSRWPALRLRACNHWSHSEIWQRSMTSIVNVCESSHMWNWQRLER